MDITAEKESKYYILSIQGDLDASSCILLDKAIAEAVEKNEKKIIIDCARLNYIASAGLGVFMSYIQEFENNQVALVLCNLSEKVRNVFQILGLDELIKIVSTKEEAKALIN
jgi:anti-sigma B factor antagonist